MAPLLKLAALAAFVATGHSLRFTIYGVRSTYAQGSQASTSEYLRIFNIDECDVGSCDADSYSWGDGNLCASTHLGPVEVCGRNFYIRNFNDGSENCVELANQYDNVRGEGKEQGDIYAQLREDGQFAGTCRIDYEAPHRDNSVCPAVSTYNAVVTCETITG